MDIAQIEILLDCVAFVASTALGIMVFLPNKKSWTNRLFLKLSLLIDAYIVVNYLSLHPPVDTPGSQLFWIRVVMFTCSFIGPSLVLLADTFPKEVITMRRRYIVPLLLLMFASAGLSLSPLVFSGIEYPNGNPVPTPGPGIFVFITDFVGMFILSFIILIYKFRHSVGVERSKLRYLLIGVLTSFSLMGLTTVLFVTILKTSNFVFLGPVFTVILMSCIARAIVKYQMFNLKVFATQMLIGTLWVLLLSKTIISGSLSERVIDAIILGGTFIVGAFLIRSVGREIRQREQLQILNKQYNEANAKLQELDRARAEFISIASHQLRTPPATIKWYLASVQSGDFGEIPPAARDALTKAEMTNNSQISLIDDLLNASRIERGKMEFLFEEGSLVALAKAAYEQLVPQAKMHRLELIFNSPEVALPPVIMDKEKLRQVVNNFIDNAIKYTREGSVSVSVFRDGDNLVVKVQDTGKGISQEQEAFLFEKYNRGRDSVMQSTGLGLGLWVAKVIIEQHHGKIWAESNGLASGASFCFSLPINNALQANSTGTLDLSKNKH